MLEWIVTFGSASHKKIVFISRILSSALKGSRWSPTKYPSLLLRISRDGSLKASTNMSKVGIPTPTPPSSFWARAWDARPQHTLCQSAHPRPCKMDASPEPRLWRLRHLSPATGKMLMSLFPLHLRHELNLLPTAFWTPDLSHLHWCWISNENIRPWR